MLLVPSLRTADDLVAAGAPARRAEIVEEGADHLPAADDAGAEALLERLGARGAYLLSVSTLEPGRTSCAWRRPTRRPVPGSAGRGP